MTVVCMRCGKATVDFVFDKDLKPICKDCIRPVPRLDLNTENVLVETKNAQFSVVMNDLEQYDLSRWIK